MSQDAILRDVGVVVIARNEGERLLACLDSLGECAGRIVYADSASSDGSPARALARGVEVLALDPSRPLNAARGRNEGFARLMELHPGLEYVFFVDGDCALVPGFLAAARACLLAHPTLGAVFGRRRERAPAQSFFNRVVDSEWDAPVGAAETFGGDVLVRVSALRAAGGYHEAMNQGEDPELAFRMRRAGFGVRRIAHEMTLHDVALTSFSAWRRRHARGGYAYAHGAALHWRDPGRYNQRRLLSIAFWGAGLPLFVLVALLPSGGLSLAALAAYALPWWRIRASRLALGESPGHAARYAALIAFGKLFEAAGAAGCLWALATGSAVPTVEYKQLRREDERRAAA